MAMGVPSWPNLQCLVRRKPATASAAGWAEDADRGGGQRLARTLSVPHLAAIGTHRFLGFFFVGMQSLSPESSLWTLERVLVLSLNLLLSQI
jgi:hypothetical protein